jgi:hypothetical protein
LYTSCVLGLRPFALYLYYTILLLIKKRRSYLCCIFSLEPTSNYFSHILILILVLFDADILVPLDNYISRGTAHFLTCKEPDYQQSLWNMISSVSFFSINNFLEEEKKSQVLLIKKKKKTKKPCEIFFVTLIFCLIFHSVPPLWLIRSMRVVLIMQIMADKNMEDNDIEPAPKLIQVVFQNCKGQVDQWVEPYLRITVERLRRAEKSYLKCLLMQVVRSRYKLLFINS